MRRHASDLTQKVGGGGWGGWGVGLGGWDKIPWSSACCEALLHHLLSLLLYAPSTPPVSIVHLHWLSLSVWQVGIKWTGLWQVCHGYHHLWKWLPSRLAKLPHPPPLLLGNAYNDCIVTTLKEWSSGQWAKPCRRKQYRFFCSKRGIMFLHENDMWAQIAKTFFGTSAQHHLTLMNRGIPCRWEQLRCSCCVDIWWQPHGFLMLLSIVLLTSSKFRWGYITQKHVIQHYFSLHKN